MTLPWQTPQLAHHFLKKYPRWAARNSAQALRWKAIAKGENPYGEFKQERQDTPVASPSPLDIQRTQKNIPPT